MTNYRYAPIGVALVSIIGAVVLLFWFVLSPIAADKRTAQLVRDAAMNQCSAHNGNLQQVNDPSTLSENGLPVIHFTALCNNGGAEIWMTTDGTVQRTIWH